MMEIEGKQFAQSVVLARYAAKQVGLYPLTDHLAALEVDMIVDATADIMNAVISDSFLERDEERKAKKIAKMNKYFLPAMLAGLQARIPDGSSAYFLGAKISLADIAVFNVIDNLLLPEKDEFPIDFEGNFPKLLDVVESVKREPGIAAYLADEKNERPIRPTF